MEEDAALREESVEPALAKPLLAVLATLESIEEEFPVIEELPHTPVNL